MRFKWGGPFSLFECWGIECGGSDFRPEGRMFVRRVRIGWLTFDFGHYWIGGTR